MDTAWTSAPSYGFRPFVRNLLIKLDKICQPTSSPPPVRHINTVTLTSAMRGPPDIADSDIPCPIVKLAHLPDIHPPPILAHFDFVVGAHLDPLAIHVKEDRVSRSDHPFPNPFALMGPHRDL